MDELLYHIKCNERVSQITPSELIGHFKSTKEFIEWLRIDECGEFLHDVWAAFFEEDLMDYCKIIESEMKRIKL